MNRGHKVRPLNTAGIRKAAQNIKDLVQVKEAYFPITMLLELMHERGMIELEIEEKNKMPNDFGLTYPQQNRIVIREDVYDEALDGGGFGRFTLAHELGHFVLHKDVSVFARNQHGGGHKIYEDSEWQADKFAQELLVDARCVTSADTVENLKSKFGISHKAAEVTYRALNKRGKYTPSTNTRGKQ